MPPTDPYAADLDPAADVNDREFAPTIAMPSVGAAMAALETQGELDVLDATTAADANALAAALAADRRAATAGANPAPPPQHSPPQYIAPPEPRYVAPPQNHAPRQHEPHRGALQPPQPRPFPAHAPPPGVAAPDAAPIPAQGASLEAALEAPANGLRMLKFTMVGCIPLVAFTLLMGVVGIINLPGSGLVFMLFPVVPAAVLNILWLRSLWVAGQVPVESGGRSFGRAAFVLNVVSSTPLLAALIWFMLVLITSIGIARPSDIVPMLTVGSIVMVLLLLVVPMAHLSAILFMSLTWHRLASWLGDDAATSRALLLRNVTIGLYAAQVVLNIATATGSLVLLAIGVFIVFCIAVAEFVVFIVALSAVHKAVTRRLQSPRPHEPMPHSAPL